MPDIFHDFLVNSPASKVFEAIATPRGLDAWWTVTSSGIPAEGERYGLYFGDGYDWKAVVTRITPDREFEIQLTEADADWTGTRVGFQLNEENGATAVRFHHTGWPHSNEHFRISCFCWAMYLRLARRYVEKGEIVPYADRLEV